MNNTRDYFAGLAMQAILQTLIKTEGFPLSVELESQMTFEAYEIADAMLDERKEHHPAASM